MEQLGKHSSFEWLDIFKLQSDPFSMLNDLGLGAFPHLLDMVKTSFCVLIMERERKSIIESKVPFLGSGVNDIGKLRQVAAAVEALIQLFSASMQRDALSSTKEKQPYSPVNFLSGPALKILAGDPDLKGKWVWNLDKPDYLAFLVLRQLDFAYQELQLGRGDQALQLYATAKQYHDCIVTEIMIPNFNLMRIAQDQGREEIINDRSVAGGRAKQQKSEIERDAIRTAVYEALRRADPSERKSRNSAFTGLVKKMRSKFKASPPAGMGSNFHMSDAAFKSVIKDFFELENPAKLK